MVRGKDKRNKGVVVCDNPRGEEPKEVEGEVGEGDKRLQRIKIQSRKNFKFRKTRKRTGQVPEETIGEDLQQPQTKPKVK